METRVESGEWRVGEGNGDREGRHVLIISTEDGSAWTNNFSERGSCCDFHY